MALIENSSFVISTNGYIDSPAQALRVYLLARKALSVTVVAHPLDIEGGNRHVVTTYERGELVREDVKSLPNRPPFTYAFDLAVPTKLPRCDAWFGFNNLACFRGLVRRKAGRAGKVFYWAVDFVPDRFGSGLFTRAYDRLDRLACVSADGRIELSEAALKGRSARLSLREPDMAPTLVAPMGAWLDRVPTVSESAWNERRVVYLGHLVERQGVERLLEALSILEARDAGVKAEIVGRGPLAQTLRQQSQDLGLGDRVVFHGFIEDHRDVEAILASGSVAAAPYLAGDDNFTRYADPGKLKAYLAAGLPVVLTSVPPNAAEIAASGAGVVVSDSAEAIADGIEGLLADRDDWLTATRAAKALARRFDWNEILSRTLGEIGYR